MSEKDQRTSEASAMPDYALILQGVADYLEREGLHGHVPELRTLVDAVRRCPFPLVGVVNEVANAFRGSTAYLHHPDGRFVVVSKGERMNEAELCACPYGSPCALHPRTTEARAVVEARRGAFTDEGWAEWQATRLKEQELAKKAMVIVGTPSREPWYCPKCGQLNGMQRASCADCEAPTPYPCTDYPSPFGPKCPGGSACENAVFVEEYKRVDAMHDAAKRQRIERIEAWVRSSLDSLDHDPPEAREARVQLMVGQLRTMLVVADERLWAPTPTGSTGDGR